MKLALCILISLAACGILVARPPNVLLIVSDDQGYADLGCVSEGVIAPNLDRLAAEGTRLTSFYVTWPACTPSRGSLLSGRYPQRNGLYDMIRNEAPDYGKKYAPEEYAVTFERIGGMDVREVLISDVLRKAGFRCGIFGKWDLGVHRRFLPLQRGFHEFYGFVNTGIDYYTHERYGVPSMYRDNAPATGDKGLYATDLFRREAERFLNENRGKPFFLYVPFNAPHSSSNLDPAIRSTVQAPDAFKKLFPAVERERIEGSRYGKTAMVASREARRRDYLAAVACMDAAIGSLLGLLDHHRIAKDTLVIFFSDNGGGGGADNRPLRGGKGRMFEGGLRVPCIVRWPGRVPAGKTNDAFLTSLEVFPTIAKAVGAELPEKIVYDGFDMLPVLRGEEPSPRTEMFWQRRGDKAARVGSWKWVASEKGGGLFDLAKDMGEKNDLSSAYPDQLAKMKARFEAWEGAMEAAEPRGPFRDF